MGLGEEVVAMDAKGRAETALGADMPQDRPTPLVDHLEIRVTDNSLPTAVPADDESEDEPALVNGVGSDPDLLLMPEPGPNDPAPDPALIDVAKGSESVLSVGDLSVGDLSELPGAAPRALPETPGEALVVASAPASEPEARPEPEPTSDPELESPGGAVPELSPPLARNDADRDLRRATRRLRNQVHSLPLALELPTVTVARRERELMLAQLDDYLLPRLARMDAPLLAVIGGSTGAGKSTLTNSLAGRVVSRSGVLRPTTRSPVLVHHPHDSGAFLTQRILPDLARITSEALEPLQPIEVDAPRITALRLVPHEGLAPGLGLLDAPDIDSVVEANRDLAVQLLGAADLWLFVTTAARYGDAMPWQMLRTAAKRGVSVAVVLDRVPPESLQEVRGHLARMLRDRGLGSSPVFVIPETSLYDGLLPWNSVAPLHRWLARLATDSRAREVVVRRTLTGIVDSLPQRSRLLVAAANEQEVAAHLLGTELDAGFATARSTLTKRLTKGTVLRGEVLARWQELVGNGDLVRHLERATGRLTDRIAAAVRKPQPMPTEALGHALVAAVGAVIDSGVHEAVEHALARWQELPGGAGLVARTGSAAKDTAAPGPVVPSSGTTNSGTNGAGPMAGAGELVRQWHAGLVEAVRGVRAQPGVTGRTLALRPESVAALVTFVSLAADPPAVDGRLRRTTGVAESGELPPAEIAGGVSLARQVLDAVYGEPAIQVLVDATREDLRSRVEELLSAERAALKALLDGAKVRSGAADTLQAAVKVVEDAR
jgi:energy-coupling factor transporter ATP-binding protein EcfA2